MHALLLLIAALISYGSLYPFHFAANDNWLREAVALFTAPELRMSRGDLVGNLLLFAPYGLVAVLLSHARRPPHTSAGGLVPLLVLGLLLALALQLTQLWVPSRVPALSDVAANGAGMLLGATTAGLAHKLFPAAATHPLRHTASMPHAFAPAVLMLLWLSYQWFPLVPTLDLQNIINALKPLLRAPQIDGVRTLHTALAWAAFFKLWDISSARRMPALALATAALFVVSAKTLIVGASISPSNVIGLGLALVWLPWRQHHATLPVLVIAMFVSLFASGLMPFDPLDQPQAFHWIPFTGMLEGSMGVNLLNLIEKSFFYGALIVLLSTKGGHPMAAAIVVALCLGTIEAAQTFLPNRMAESTDPVLALILGFVAGLGAPRGRHTHVQTHRSTR